LNTGPGQYSGSFSSSLVFDTFTLDLSFLTGTTVATSVITSNLNFGSGYDITSVLFDGFAYTALQDTPAPIAINMFHVSGPRHELGPHHHGFGHLSGRYFHRLGRHQQQRGAACRA
jgi:hypothetical protein